MKKKLCFDLDGVICTTKGNNYIQAKPKKKVINFINKLSKKYYIIIFTARYMGRNNELTYKQLVQWNLKFDKLLMGKPSYDFIIDDKGYGFKKNWYQNFKLKD